jgi:hypothetical protein
LLNCYTKTGDRSRLDAFIKAEVGKSAASVDELPFDLDTAIKVCRQAGFFEHATYLAKKWDRHEDYLRIQIEDAEQYGDALRYLRSLGPEAVRLWRTSSGAPLITSARRTWCFTAACSYNTNRTQRPSCSSIFAPVNWERSRLSRR